MRIAIGADHAGFEMKRDLAGYLAQGGHEVTDLGTHSTAPVDYPDIAEAVAQAIRNGQADRGVLVCGSGAGAAVAACKFPGVARRGLPRRLFGAPGGGARRPQRPVPGCAGHRPCPGAHVGRPVSGRRLYGRRAAPRATGEDRCDQIALRARGMSEEFGPQPLEQRVPCSHTVEHRLGREPEFRIEGFGSFQPGVPKQRVGVLLVNARADF